jgi:hypothetical protein
VNAVYKALTKEPVLLGAVFLAVGDAAVPEGSPWRGVVIAAVAWVVRMLSTPAQRVAEKVEEARYVGAVEHQATALAGRLAAGRRS